MQQQCPRTNTTVEAYDDDKSTASSSTDNKPVLKRHRIFHVHSWQMLTIILNIFLLNVLSCQALILAVPDAIIHFSVGAVAGGAGAIAAYPFDYIKSQMQTEYGRQTYENGADAFVKTVAKNPLNLYKGVGVQLLGIAPEKGIKLGVNDMLQATFLAQMGCFPLWGQIVSGGIAGACQVVASSPLEVMKVGLQTSDMNFEQVWAEVGGVSGLFRGAEACIVRDVLFTAICFPLYAAMIHSDVPAFVAGAASGVVGSFAATPPDFVKTRILSQDKWSQQQRTTTASLIGTATNGTSTLVLQEYSNQKFYNNDNNNPFIVARKIMEREGVTIMFSGVTERCLGAIPRFGTTLAMHDVLEQMVSQAGWLSHSISI